ncbi:alpha/beta hydrolase [Solwaraspora sp. WMMD791]|uniref:alpha/beta hydrolase family protein n=1 Tax=Solwaraspora sp. WMMD791 TaxID=3016086 RepID=UPI00249CB018|nr:alpha/beta hydrolase [Solwaraspora sp. WMMD791]WFE26998.1 alpha/beta hydrolase [Solwaraspora sp. WMMD791]
MDDVLQQMADGFSALHERAPILHTPDEAGLAYENVTFASGDGVPLEGWFIPAPGSRRVVIANHPLGFTRAGLPSHLEPWHSRWAASGNGIEVDFIRDYKILHDAGYHVLAYDMRNSGHSGAANGGVISARYCARDVLGSLAYTRSRSDLRDPAIGLFSRCMGANATMSAMAMHPGAFRDVRCMVAPQPLSVRVALERSLELVGMTAADHIEDLGELIRRHTSLRMDDDSPVEAAGSVTVPTFLYQVKDDILTRPSDVQSMYDNIPIPDKELFWIEGSTRRWDGYLQFAKDPSRMLAWFGRHMVG